MSFEVSREKCCGNYVPTEKEHKANILTHGFTIPLAAVWAILFFYSSKTYEQTVVSLVYGIPFVTLFCVSTWFHIECYTNPYSFKGEILRRCDRAAIYLYIAASYQPWFSLLEITSDDFHVNFSWTLWILGISGVIFELFYSIDYPLLGICSFVMFGLVPGVYLMSAEGFPGMPMLKFSGSLYIIGVLFFKCDGIILYAHSIWHVFVSSAAIFHSFNIYFTFYV